VSKGKISKRKLAKKKRRKKARKEKALLTNTQDCHHLFYYRKDYKTKILRELREFYYCKLYVPKDTLHKTLHAMVKNVPVPKEVNAREVLRHLRLLESQGAISSQDGFEKRVDIIAALLDCVEQPTADALRVQAKIAHEFKKPST